MRFTAGVDKTDTPHIVVGNLVATEVDRVFCSQFGVHLLVDLAEFDSRESSVVFRQFLFYDIRFNRNTQVVGLSRQVGCGMIVHTVFFEFTIAQVAP